MTPPPVGLVDAWVTAGRELGIEVVPRFELGGTGTFAALVKGFGSERGTAISWLGTNHRLGEAGEQGYFVSVLNSEVYAVYQRTLFVETLIDWGWHSTSEPPAWYSAAVSGGSE